MSWVHVLLVSLLSTSLVLPLSVHGAYSFTVTDVTSAWNGTITGNAAGPILFKPDGTAYLININQPTQVAGNVNGGDTIASLSPSGVASEFRGNLSWAADGFFLPYYATLQGDALYVGSRDPHVPLVRIDTTSTDLDQQTLITLPQPPTGYERASQDLVNYSLQDKPLVFRANGDLWTFDRINHTADGVLTPCLLVLTFSNAADTAPQGRWLPLTGAPDNFTDVTSLLFDASGNLFITNSGSQDVMRVTADSVSASVASVSGAGSLGTTPLQAESLGFPAQSAAYYPQYLFFTTPDVLVIVDSNADMPQALFFNISAPVDCNNPYSFQTPALAQPNNGAYVNGSVYLTSGFGVAAANSVGAVLRVNYTSTPNNPACAAQPTESAVLRFTSDPTSQLASITNAVAAAAGVSTSSVTAGSVSTTEPSLSAGNARRLLAAYWYVPFTLTQSISAGAPTATQALANLKANVAQLSAYSVDTTYFHTQDDNSHSAASSNTAAVLTLLLLVSATLLAA